MFNNTINPFPFALRTPMQVIESNFVAPISRPPVEKSPNQPDIQTNVQLANPEANSPLNISETPLNFGQSILRSSDIIQDIQLQSQLDSFLNSCLNVDRESPSTGVMQNDEPASEPASANQNNEFEVNAVDIHALINEAFQCSAGTSFIAPKGVMGKENSSDESVLIGTRDDRFESNIGDGNLETIDLTPVDVDIVDLECDTSNGKAIEQAPVGRPKRKNSFERDSDLENLIKKRKVKDEWAPIRDEKDGKFHCEVCEFSTYIACSFKGHIRIHSGEKPFECQKCLQTFNEKGNLKRHERIHEKDFEFQCAICRQRFKSEDAKESHQNHCNKRNYECYLCRYSTWHKSRFTQHFRIHTGERPFQCSHCSERFGQTSSLNYHIKRNHK